MKNPDSKSDIPDDDWDELFRQRLADYTDQPPPDALNRILAGASATYVRPYRRLIYLSLVGLLLLTGVGGWLVWQQAAVKPTEVADKTQQPDRLTNANRPTPKTVPEFRPVTPTITDRIIPTKASSGRLASVTQRPAASMPFGATENSAADPITDVSTSTAKTYSKPLRSTAAHLPIATKQLRVVSNPAQLAGLADKKSTARMTRQRVSQNSLPAYNQPGDQRDSKSVALAYTPATVFTQPETRLGTVDLLAIRPLPAYVMTANLPQIASEVSTVAPQMSQPRQHPAWFVSLTPLYNYQQINPIHTDAELVSDIKVAHSLATDRLGGRLQLGVEWQLANRLSLRTSFVYQQVRQSLRYDVRSIHPDSVRVVVADDQSVQVTPIFTKHNYSETAIWHYTGLSADLVWQLNQGNRWHHYVTVGATMGRYVSRGGAINGFVQAAYGIERPLAPGLHLRIEPTLQLGWQPLIDQANRLHSLPYSYGLSLGLRFR